MPGRIAVHRLRDLRAAHAGHDDVGDEQVDLGPSGGARSSSADGPSAACEDGVAVRLQDLRDQLADDRLVLDEEDGLVAGRVAQLPRSQTVGSSARSSTRGKRTRNDEPEPGRRCDLDRAAALLDDAVHRREPEARARPPWW